MHDDAGRGIPNEGRRGSDWVPRGKEYYRMEGTRWSMHIGREIFMNCGRRSRVRRIRVTRGARTDRVFF